MKIIQCIAVALALGLQPAHAAVSTCNALTLYGWGKTQGRFTALNANANSNVAQFSNGGGQVDSHLTFFNAAAPLHLTIYVHPCRENAPLDGAVFQNFILNPAPPLNKLCNVSVVRYMNTVNEVIPGPAQPGQSVCSTGFLNSGLTPAQVTTWVNLCNASHCP